MTFGFGIAEHSRCIEGGKRGEKVRMGQWRKRAGMSFSVSAVAF